MCNEDEEDDDYEYIGNEKSKVKSYTNNTLSSASINKHSSSGVIIKDKNVRYLLIYYKYILIIYYFKDIPVLIFKELCNI